MKLSPIHYLILAGLGYAGFKWYQSKQGSYVSPLTSGANASNAYVPSSAV